MSLASPSDNLAQIASYAREMAAAQEQARIERARDMERIRGIKYIRLALPQPTVPISVSIDGPSPGYAWNLKIVSVTLTGADSVAIYSGGGNGGDTANARLLGYIPPVSAAAPAQPVGVFTWSSSQAVLFNGEGLFLATSGAFRFSLVGVTAVQVPAEQIGKIIS